MDTVMISFHNFYVIIIKMMIFFTDDLVTTSNESILTLLGNDVQVRWFCNDEFAWDDYALFEYKVMPRHNTT